MKAPLVEATDVEVAGPHDALVRRLSFVAPPGEVTVVPIDAGEGQVALALALAGRVHLAAGTVTAYGSDDVALLQGITRVIDADGVTAPEHALTVRAVVAEELALAEQPSSRRAVAEVLSLAGLGGRARDRWDSVDPGVRTRLLVDLATRRPGTRVVVLAGVDRHGGAPDEWMDGARHAAESGLTVVVICTPGTAALLATGATA